MALAGGIGAALMVLWFLFRPRPPQFDVNSHVLWDQVAPKKRNPLLKELLMLLLQIAMVVGIALALGDPRWTAAEDDTPGAEPITAPLDRLHLVDRSLSMSARTEVGVTRLEAVVDAITDDLDALPKSVRVGLVGMGAQSELLAPIAGDRARFRLALRTLKPEGLGLNLARGLALIEAMPSLRPADAHLEVWTDDPAAVRSVAEWSERTSIPSIVRAPFGPAPNLAITAFDLGAARGIPAEEEALVRVANPSPWPATVTLALETVDARLGEATLTLEPGEEVERRYRFLPLPGSGFEAVLRNAAFEGGPADVSGVALGDALSADDRAYAWVEPVLPVTIWLVSDGNRYLERVLTVLPGVQLTRITPADYRAGRGRGAASADVVFFDSFVPLEKRDGPLPPRSVLFSPPASRSPVPVLGTTEKPVVTDWDLDHPLFRGLVLRDLEVEASLVFQPEEGDVRLLGTTTGSLVVGRQRGDRRLVLWGFDLGASDLPLRLAFPQTIVNTVLWMRDSRPIEPAQGSRHRLEDPYLLEAEAGVVVTDLRQAAYARAAGDQVALGRSSWPLTVGDGPTPYRFPRPGLFSVVDGQQRTDLGVNLFSLTESRTSEVPGKDARVVPAPVRNEDPDDDGRTPWLLLAGGAFLIGMVEFGMYTR